MRNFALYHHPHRGYEAVKQGFSWPGFWFTWLWAFVKGLYVTGVVLLVAVVLLRVLAETREPGLVWLAALGTLVVALGVGFKGNDWRETSLVNRGYQLMDTLQAENPDVAVNRLVQMRGIQNSGNVTGEGGRSFCERCGDRISDNALFCQFCGNPRHQAPGAQPAEVRAESELQPDHPSVSV